MHVCVKWSQPSPSTHQACALWKAMGNLTTRLAEKVAPKGAQHKRHRCPVAFTRFHRFHMSKFSNGLAKHSESQRNIVKHCRQNMPKSCTNWVWGASPWRVRCFSRVSRPQVQKMVRLQPESIQSFHGHHGPRVGLPKKTRRASLCFFLCSPGTGQSKAWMFDGRACSRGKGTNGFGRIWPNYVKQSCYNDAKCPSMGWHVVAGRDRNNISATHSDAAHASTKAQE